MARRLFSVAALCVCLTGCVAQDKYNALKLEKDQAVEQLGQAQTEAAAAKAERDALKGQLDGLLANNKDAGALARTLGQENAELKAQLAALDERYKKALNERGEIVNAPLPPELEQELQRLARENPDLMEVDAARGVVKLKSDVTFAKGSADLTPQAKNVIRRLAGVLNSPVARNYEFQLVGHTDITPVSNPATIRAGHRDNWYLSAHRAISVENELARQGVSQRRMGVAGYAEQRPIATNTTSDGMARNRRVEIVLLPTTMQSGPGVSETVSTPVNRSAATNTRKTAPVVEMNKDAGPDPRSFMNK